MATKKDLKKPGYLKERWETLDPSQKKKAMIAVSIFAVLILAFMVMKGTESGSDSKARTTQGKIQNALLPDGDDRDLGISAVDRSIREQNTTIRQLQGEVARLKTQIAREQERSGGREGQRLADEISRMRAELDSLRQEQARLASQPAQTVASPQQGGAATSQPDPASTAFGGIRAVHQTEQAAPRGSAPGGMASMDPGSPGGDPRGRLADEDRLYLPGGSILRGVLLSGVDAPTGKAAMRDPLPVLARLKYSAILPNRYRADVKECFMLLEAVGDLASERAYMRPSIMSCVRTDRTVIEVPVNGFAVGEDGRAGLRGEVVTKQGAVLGRATLAGFADGLARAFGRGNTITLGGTGLSGDTLETGAMMGASSALDRISQWYLERADELHPTISIDSGREITIVMTRGREAARLRASAMPPMDALPIPFPVHAQVQPQDAQKPVPGKDG